MTTMSVLLEADLNAKGFRENLANLVFCGTFILVAIGVGIWWLRKG